MARSLRSQAKKRTRGKYKCKNRDKENKRVKTIVFLK